MIIAYYCVRPLSQVLCLHTSLEIAALPGPFGRSVGRLGCVYKFCQRPQQFNWREDYFYYFKEDEPDQRQTVPYLQSAVYRVRENPRFFLLTKESMLFRFHRAPRL